MAVLGLLYKINTKSDASCSGINRSQTSFFAPFTCHRFQPSTQAQKIGISSVAPKNDESKRRPQASSDQNKRLQDVIRRLQDENRRLRDELQID
jgi:hypothetical protein